MSILITRMRRFVWSERGRIARYLVSGISAVATDAVLYFALTRAAHVYFLVANIISLLCGGVVAFVLNKYWSFRAHANTVRQSRRFAILFAANYLFQQAALYFLHGVLGVHDGVAKLFLIACSTLWNFLLYRAWVYAVE